MSSAPVAPMDPQAYLASVTATQEARLRWWHEARFGMFIHWGLYAQLGRGEWAMNRERIPLADYEKLAATWQPKLGAAREWAALAKQAGMKYMVMTTKHHEGFLLWDSKHSDYNAVKRGPGRDLVREFVEAAREFGLKVGFYYSLMDWHHPDGHACARDEAARQRFTAYTRELVRELCTNYGLIDILWYDVSWPLGSPEAWESYALNQMVRALQPHILINDRSQLPEDFGTPEEHISAANAGRAWEACMTFNGAWGWQPSPPDEWLSARRVLGMLRQVSAGGGNLLLNIGPLPDGSVPPEAVERLHLVGQWLARYGSIVYGQVDRVEGMEWGSVNQWSRRGNALYCWIGRWPGQELAIGGLRGKVLQVKVLPDGQPLPYTQEPDRLVIRGLPPQNPDAIVGMAVLELLFDTVPRQVLGAGYEPVVVDRASTAPVASDQVWHGPYLSDWQLSLPRPLKGSVARAKAVSLKEDLGWQPISASNPPGFVNAHTHYPLADGVVYLATTVKVAQAGAWTIHLGHDGGARLFVNGRAVYADAHRANPARPDRGQAQVKLAKGKHELVVALDLDAARGWGIFCHFSVPEAHRGSPTPPAFPELV